MPINIYDIRHCPICNTKMSGQTRGFQIKLFGNPSTPIEVGQFAMVPTNRLMGLIKGIRYRTPKYQGDETSSVSCYVCPECGHIELVARHPERFMTEDETETDPEQTARYSWGALSN